VAANLAIAVIPQQVVIPESCRRDGRVAEGARLESVFTRKGNVGSNPTLSAMFSTTYKRLQSVCNHFRRKSQSHHFGMRLGHFIRNNVAVNVERRANVRVAHQFLLHSNCCSDRIQP
jgi:hypothetical protein